MMRAFLFWLTGRLPCRIISDGDQPYLERYYVATILGWRFYLHRFVASDPDRGLHDHPWTRAFSIVLSGWYWEQTRSGERRVAWLNSLTGDTFHRVVLPHGRTEHRVPGHLRKIGDTLGAPVVPCWTLFFHRTGHRKPWGFWHSLGPGVAIFEEYQYPKEGNQRHWWLRAPKGHAEPRRMPR